MSLWEKIKEGLSKTTLANIAAFLLVIGLMIYGLYYNEKEIIVLAGGWGGGYLFGVSNNK